LSTNQRWTAPIPERPLHGAGAELERENVRRTPQTVIFPLPFASFTTEIECHELIQKLVCEGAKKSKVF